MRDAIPDIAADILAPTKVCTCAKPTPDFVYEWATQFCSCLVCKLAVPFIWQNMTKAGRCVDQQQRTQHFEAFYANLPQSFVPDRG